MNHTYKKKQEQAVIYEQDVILFPRTDLNYTSQSTLRTAIFRVTADIQNDVYHLFAYDGNTREYTYVNIAYIGSRTLSVYMNKLFRNIRENDNVDYGEESEDEDYDSENDEHDYEDYSTEDELQSRQGQIQGSQQQPNLAVLQALSQLNGRVSEARDLRDLIGGS